MSGSEGLSARRQEADGSFKVVPATSLRKGDVVLVHLARMLKGNLLRSHDLAGRLGGEEFAVLLPGTTAQEATAIGERLRRALEQSGIRGGGIN